MRLNTYQDDFATVIPLYNKGETIARALNSVIAQTVHPKEIIVVDDGSSDNGPAIVEEMARTHPSIRLITQANRGVSAARNHGAAAATASIICFLDADDEWAESHLATIRELTIAHPDADVYSSGYAVVLPTGETIRQKVALPVGYSGVVDDFIDTYRKGHGLIQSSTACLRRSFLDKLGGFPEGQHRGEDLYLWLLAGLHGRVAYADALGARIYRGQHAGRTARRALPFYHLEHFVPRLPDMPPQQRRRLKRFLIKNVWTHWAGAKLAGDRETPKHLLETAGRLSPLFWLALYLADNLVPAPLLIWRLKLKRRRMLLPPSRVT